MPGASIYLFHYFLFSEIDDLDEESSDDEETLEEQSKGSGSGFWSGFSSLVGSKPLTRADITPVITKMQDHLISKNVATDVAVKLCESVASNMEGKVLGRSGAQKYTSKHLI